MAEAAKGIFNNAFDDGRQMQKISTEYMDVKCGIEENGNEIATFQHRERRKQFYKPGIYFSKKDCCWWSYQPKLNHLVISKKELRFSYAKEMGNKLWHSLWITCCCLNNIRA